MVSLVQPGGHETLADLQLIPRQDQVARACFLESLEAGRTSPQARSSPVASPPEGFMPDGDAAMERAPPVQAPPPPTTKVPPQPGMEVSLSEDEDWEQQVQAPQWEVEAAAEAAAARNRSRDLHSGSEHFS